MIVFFIRGAVIRYGSYYLTNMGVLCGRWQIFEPGMGTKYFPNLFKWSGQSAGMKPFYKSLNYNYYKATADEKFQNFFEKWPPLYRRS